MSVAPAITLTGGAMLEGAVLFAPLSLTMKGGAWTCLLGPSGVGKSTILRLIAGLDVPVDFDGSITASDNAPVPPRIAYMAQSDLLLPWASVTENVAIGARLRGERPDLTRAQGLIDRVGLTDHAAKKPHALSGGQRQRAALARTLMEDRVVILLDEPFSALDARTRAEMQDLAAELLTGRTVLLVTHDPGEAARLGQSIHVMTGRDLRAFGAPDTAAPRAVDDPAMLGLQGDLHRFLREAA
ncbi:MAG: ABC transporter ATP-binding protein [Pseudomonadota bacterium]